MPRFPRVEATLVFLVLGSSSCQRRQVAVPVPPPAASQPVQQPPATAASSPATPGTQAGPQPNTQTQEPNKYQVNKPPQAAKRPARPATSPAPAAASSTPPASVAPPSAPTPKLGDILTADEQKQYSASIDQSLSRAQNSLNSIAGRQLTKDQQAQVAQIRSFMEQAKSTRTSDAAGAKSLAERAEVLARDLAGAVQNK